MSVLNTLNVYEDPYNIQDPRIGGTDGGKAFDISLSGNTLTFTHPTTGKKINFTLRTWYWFVRGTKLNEGWSNRYMSTNSEYTTTNFTVYFSYGTSADSTFRISKSSTARISGSATLYFTYEINSMGGTTTKNLTYTLTFNGSDIVIIHSDAIYASEYDNEIGTARTGSGDLVFDKGNSYHIISRIYSTLTIDAYPYTRTQV